MVESLIPSLIEAGINCLQPLEVKAGMDLLRIKKAFGDRIALIGGMDVRTLLTNDLDVVRRELEAKVPGVMQGAATSCKSITAFPTRSTTTPIAISSKKVSNWELTSRAVAKKMAEKRRRIELTLLRESVVLVRL